MTITDENGKYVDVKNYSRKQKETLKKFYGCVSSDDNKIKLEPLLDHLELVDYEWISKKGIHFVSVNGTQLILGSLKYYSVDVNTGTIHHTGVLTGR